MSNLSRQQFWILGVFALVLAIIAFVDSVFAQNCGCNEQSVIVDLCVDHEDCEPYDVLNGCVGEYVASFSAAFFRTDPGETPCSNTLKGASGVWLCWAKYACVRGFQNDCDPDSYRSDAFYAFLFQDEKCTNCPKE